MSSTSVVSARTPLFSASTASLGGFQPLTAGPYWPSFEQLRTGGPAGLERISGGSVGTLALKSVVFRILRDEDFQRLLGLASEVHRLKSGLRIVFQAAKIVEKHQDSESIELLVNSVSLLGESSLLPIRQGHGRIEVNEEELRELDSNADTDEDLKACDISRPL